MLLSSQNEEFGEPPMAISSFSTDFLTLVLSVIWNTSLLMVMCLSRTARGSLYFASTAVVMCEALKLAVLMLLADPHAPQILCQKVRSLHTRNDIFPSPALLSA